MKKLFVAQFMNTAVNIVVVSGSWPWLKRTIAGTPFAGVIFQGEAARRVTSNTLKLGFHFS